MELSKKTTILFSPELHARLSRIAAQRKLSLGELVRSACERQYGLVSREHKVAAVRELGELQLPVATPDQMERESVPSPDELVP